MSFENLNKLKASMDVTREIKFSDLLLNDKDPVSLQVKFSGKSNTAYQNAMKRGANENIVSLLQGESLSEEQIQEQNEHLIKCLSKHVIVDWGNVFNDEGKPVSFSSQECENFLTKLDEVDHKYISRIVSFSGDRKKFSEEGFLSEKQIEKTAKN